MYRVCIYIYIYIFFSYFHSIRLTWVEFRNRLGWKRTNKSNEYLKVTWPWSLVYFPWICVERQEGAAVKHRSTNPPKKGRGKSPTAGPFRDLSKIWPNNLFLPHGSELMWRRSHIFTNLNLVGGWTHQPLWKICASQNGFIFPHVLGWKFQKYVSNKPAPSESSLELMHFFLVGGFNPFEKY